MELVRFIFQSFWHFLGTLMLLSVILSAFNKDKIIHNHYYLKKDDVNSYGWKEVEPENKN